MSTYANRTSHFQNIGLDIVLNPIMLAGALPFRLYYLVFTDRLFKELVSDRVLHLLVATFFLVMAGTVIRSTGFQNRPGSRIQQWQDRVAMVLFLAVLTLIEGVRQYVRGYQT